MRRDQVNKQQAADDITAGEPGNSKSRAGRREIKKEAFEIAILRLVDPDMDLVERTDKDQYHRASQTEDGQLQRGQWLKPTQNTIACHSSTLFLAE